MKRKIQQSLEIYFPNPLYEIRIQCCQCGERRKMKESERRENRKDDKKGQKDQNIDEVGK